MTLVEELREMGSPKGMYRELGERAAAEIERLRELVNARDRIILGLLDAGIITKQEIEHFNPLHFDPKNELQ